MGAAGGLASAEYLGAVLGDEQRQRHRAGCGQPAAPGRPGRVHVQVQGDALVLDQPRLGRSREQLVEQGGHLFAPSCCRWREHGAERVPGLARVGQVAVIDVDPAGFVMGEQQLTQLALVVSRSSCRSYGAVLISATASPAHRADPNRMSAPMTVTVSDMKPVTGDLPRGGPARCRCQKRLARPQIDASGAGGSARC